MNNNNALDSLQLEEMKQQMDVLRKKLSTQELVNEKLLRQAMSYHYSWIDRSTRIWIIIALLAVPYIIYAFRHLITLSWPFVIYTECYMLACATAIIFTRNTLLAKHFLTENMKQVGARLLRVRKYDRIAKIITFPMLAVFFVWFIIEVAYATGHFECSPAFIGGIAGAILGGIGGAIYYRKYMHTIDKLEQDVREFTEME